MKIENSETKLASAGWIVDARWYYALLAYVLGLITRIDFVHVNALVILTGALAVVMACNVFFTLTLRRLREADFTARQLNILNAAQITLDLVFFFLVLVVTGGGLANVGHSFFFLPIFVSMIIFGFRGALVVAATSGLLVFISIFSTQVIIEQIFSGQIPKITPELSSAVAQSGIIFMIYLITGFFGGHISRLIKIRDVHMHDQIAREAEHVDRLEFLSKEFDKSAKLLVRRDIELTSVNEKLTQLDKMKSEIISIVAHQLRTPLAAIKWTLKMLIDKDVGTINKEQEELLLKGFESNERMILLINDMLAADRLESGRIKYTFVPVQFEDLVQSMIRSLLTLATKKSIHVELVMPKNVLPKIKVDPDKMNDVLQNLIDNAIKYTPEKGSVVVGVAMEGENELHFWVTDSGIGIPEIEHDKIFSRFFRANNAIRSATEGSGLGLFIAQSIVKRHGGKLWFESALDKGSTFHILLPLT